MRVCGGGKWGELELKAAGETQEEHGGVIVAREGEI
jgi:hypothetical protein